MTADMPEPLTIDSLDVETLIGLFRRTDPVGVLSIYLTAQPGMGCAQHRSRSRIVSPSSSGDSRLMARQCGRGRWMTASPGTHLRSSG